jgi:hypothetical protein
MATINKQAKECERKDNKSSRYGAHGCCSRYGVVVQSTQQLNQPTTEAYFNAFNAHSTLPLSDLFFSSDLQLVLPQIPSSNRLLQSIPRPDSDAEMKWKRAKTKIKAVNNVKEGEIQLNH